MTVDEFLAPNPPRIRDLTMRTRALVLATLPGAVETVNPGRGNISYGLGAKMTGWACYIAAFRDHVNLGFLCGTQLPDPEALLEGTGKMLRHVKIRSSADLEMPALRALLLAAWHDLAART